MNGTMTFFCNFDQNGGTLKIEKCYEVLWIHNVDAICIHILLIRLLLVMFLYKTGKNA